MKVIPSLIGSERFGLEKLANLLGIPTTHSRETYQPINTWFLSKCVQNIILRTIVKKTILNHSTSMFNDDYDDYDLYFHSYAILNHST